MAAAEVRVTLKRYIALTALPETDRLPSPVSVRVVQGTVHAEGPPMLLAAHTGWLPDRDGNLGQPVPLGVGRESWQECFDALHSRTEQRYRTASIIYQRMENRIPVMAQIPPTNIEAIETL